MPARVLGTAWNASPTPMRTAIGLLRGGWDRPQGNRPVRLRMQICRRPDRERIAPRRGTGTFSSIAMIAPMKAPKHRSEASLAGSSGRANPERCRILLYWGAVAALLGAATMAPNDASGQAEFFPPDPGIKMADFPNIILITGDNLRWDHVAANGNKAIITPNMDRLASEGTTFLSHFPSHAGEGIRSLGHTAFAMSFVG